MRKAAGLLAALALMTSAGVLVASPAGAAATPTCKSLTGTQSYNPALPKLGSTTKVTSKTTVTGKLTGCTGVKGITSATTAAKGTYKGNCQTLLSAKAGTVTKGTATVTWSNKQKSTVSTSLKQISKPAAQPIMLQLKSKVTSGAFKGLTTTATLQAAAPAGSCTSKGLSKFTFKSVGKLTK